MKLVGTACHLGAMVRHRSNTNSLCFSLRVLSRQEALQSRSIQVAANLLGEWEPMLFCAKAYELHYKTRYTKSHFCSLSPEIVLYSTTNSCSVNVLAYRSLDRFPKSTSFRVSMECTKLEDVATEEGKTRVGCTHEMVPLTVRQCTVT